jgi:DNA-binding NtrC family response regulator
LPVPVSSNIRQLKNLVEKVVVLSDEKEILPETIRPHLPAGGTVFLAAGGRAVFFCSGFEIYRNLDYNINYHEHEQRAKHPKEEDRSRKEKR